MSIKLYNSAPTFAAKLCKTIKMNNFKTIIEPISNFLEQKPIIFL